MREPQGTKIAQEELGSLEPDEVLYEFDGEPLTFVARDPDGEPLLVHNLSAFDRTSRFLVSAVDSRILHDLKNGRIDILTALRQPRCWLADLGDEATIIALWAVEFASIPDNILPRPGASISPGFEATAAGPS
jgi:hypothetical protein